MLSVHWLTIKFILRLAVTGLISILVAWLFNLGTTGAVLIVLYGMLMVQSTLGATLSVTAPLVIWALIGVALGLGVGLVAEEFADIYPWTVWVALVGLVIVSAIMWPISDFSRMAPVTALVVLMMGTRTHAPLMQALMRGLYVVIGMVIALPVSYLVFPQRAANTIKAAASRIRDEIREQLKILSQALFDPTVAWDCDQFTGKVREIGKEIDRYSKLLNHVKREGSPIRDERIRGVVHGQRRMLSYLFQIAAVVREARGSYLVQSTEPYLKQLTHGIDQALEHWAIQQPNGQLLHPDADAIRADLESALEKRHEERPEMRFEELSSFFYLFYALRQYARITFAIVEETTALHKRR